MYAHRTLKPNIQTIFTKIYPLTNSHFWLHPRSTPMSKRVKGSAALNRSSAQQQQQQQAALSASGLAPAYPLTAPTTQNPPQPHHHQLQPQPQPQQQQQVNPRKRRSPPSATTAAAGISAIPGSAVVAPVMSDISGGMVETPPKKKGRTNTPWTAEEEQRLKQMRDLGKSWSEIAKVRYATNRGKVSESDMPLDFSSSN